MKDEIMLCWMACEIGRLRAENERLREENNYLRACLFHPIEVKRVDLVEQLRARLVKELYSGEG